MFPLTYTAEESIGHRDNADWVLEATARLSPVVDSFYSYAQENIGKDKILSSFMLSDFISKNVVIYVVFSQLTAIDYFKQTRTIRKMQGYREFFGFVYSTDTDWLGHSNIDTMSMSRGTNNIDQHHSHKHIGKFFNIEQVKEELLPTLPITAESDMRGRLKDGVSLQDLINYNRSISLPWTNISRRKKTRMYVDGMKSGKFLNAFWERAELIKADADEIHRTTTDSTDGTV
jgi:hypothetical protein